MFASIGAVVAIVATPLCGAGPVRLNGSSCCFRAMKGLAKQYMAGRPGVHVEVEFSTTCGGLMDLAKRGCDGAIIALPLNRFGKMGWRRAFPDGNQPVAEYLLAQTAVGIVVHKSNFVASIRIPQVRDVWAGKIGTWDRLGGAKGRINVYSMEPSRNMGGEILSDQVLDYRKWTKSRKNLLFSERVIASVAADPMGIGVVVLKHELPQRVKVLAVAQDANSAPVAATVENIVREKYPLVRKYKIVFAKERDGAAGSHAGRQGGADCGRRRGGREGRDGRPRRRVRQGEEGRTTAVRVGAGAVGRGILRGRLGAAAAGWAARARARTAGGAPATQPPLGAPLEAKTPPQVTRPGRGSGLAPVLARDVAGTKGPAAKPGPKTQRQARSQTELCMASPEFERETTAVLSAEFKRSSASNKSGSPGQ